VVAQGASAYHNIVSCQFVSALQVFLPTRDKLEITIIFYHHYSIKRSTQKFKVYNAHTKPDDVNLTIYKGGINDVSESIK
jgi:hypothetical protein